MTILTSARIDWTTHTGEVLPQFELLSDYGVLITNSDGSQELDVWYESTITKDCMISSVKEFMKSKATNGKFVPKVAEFSNRYKGLKMVMDDTTFIKPTIENCIVVSMEVSKSAYDETYHLEDDFTQEILDLSNPENPTSYEPRKYKQKVIGSSEVNGKIQYTVWFPMFSFFKQSTNIMGLMGVDMLGRAIKYENQ